MSASTPMHLRSEQETDKGGGLGARQIGILAQEPAKDLKGQILSSEPGFASVSRTQVEATMHYAASLAIEGFDLTL